MRDPVRILLLAIGGQRYAIPLADVREVLDAHAIAAVPLMPPAVAGVVDVRGIIVPVLNTALLLGIAAAPLAGQVVLASAPGAADVAGLLVDDVPGLSVSQRTLSPRARLPRFVSHLLDTTDGAVPLLDLAALLEAVQPAGAATA